MTKLTCEEVVKYLSDYLDNHLADDLAQAARDHIATCQNCRIVLDSTRKMILLYREQGRAEVLAPGRQQELYERIAAFKKK